jgi:cytoskeletal protein CcmA (bactofilin family)
MRSHGAELCLEGVMTILRRVRDTLLRRRVVVGGLVIVGLAAALAGPPVASARPDDGDRDYVTLDGTRDDVQFVAGRTVRVTATVSDDVFAAGRDVIFDAATVRNAIVAGYDIEQRGGTVADMIAAAANINIAGRIEDDVLAVARSIRITADAAVGGDVRVAAETIDMEGEIAGSMRAAARRITIAGRIDGKADLLGERIVIGPNAVISGDLIYRSENRPEIATGATIGGEIRQVEIDMPNLTEIGLAILGLGILIALAWAVATLVLIVVIQLVFPAFMTDATDRLQDHPWSNLGRGIVLLLVGGALAALFYASILGIPLGGAVTIAIAVGSLLGLVTVSYCIGLFIRSRFKSSTYVSGGGRIGWTILGAVILGIVGLIPFVGGAVVGLAVAAGVGAALAELWVRLRAA